MSGLSFAFSIAAVSDRSEYAKSIAILWCIGSTLIGFWTIYAINGTWKENRRLKRPIYGDLGFLALVLIVAFLVVVNLWTLFVAVMTPVGASRISG
jgi:Ca2+/Na+ antiporter